MSIGGGKEECGGAIMMKAFIRLVLEAEGNDEWGWAEEWEKIAIQLLASLP